MSIFWATLSQIRSDAVAAANNYKMWVIRSESKKQKIWRYVAGLFLFPFHFSISTTINIASFFCLCLESIVQWTWIFISKNNPPTPLLGDWKNIKNYHREYLSLPLEKKIDNAPLLPIYYCCLVGNLCLTVSLYVLYHIHTPIDTYIIKYCSPPDENQKVALKSLDELVKNLTEIKNKYFKVVSSHALLNTLITKITAIVNRQQLDHVADSFIDKLNDLFTGIGTLNYLVKKYDRLLQKYNMQHNNSANIISDDDIKSFELITNEISTYLECENKYQVITGLNNDDETSLEQPILSGLLPERISSTSKIEIDLIN